MIAGPTSDPLSRCWFYWAECFFCFRRKTNLTTWVLAEPRILAKKKKSSPWNFNIQMGVTLISQKKSFSVSTVTRYLFIQHQSFQRGSRHMPQIKNKSTELPSLFTHSGNNSICSMRGVQEVKSTYEKTPVAPFQRKLTWLFLKIKRHQIRIRMDAPNF